MHSDNFIQLIDNGVQLKLKLERLRALVAIYLEHVVNQPTSEEADERLLQEMMFEQYVMLFKILKKDKANNTIKMTGSQALAFMMFWGPVRIDDNYANMIVLDIIETIDKKQLTYERVKKG